MANSYPTALNNYTGNETLSAAQHAQEHNALETKLGTGASTAIASTVLRGTGTGTTAFGQVNLSTDVTGSLNVSSLTGTLPVANGGTGVTSSTGTVAVVLSTSPTLITPVLGVATATSINKVAITAPASSATLTIANGKTLTVSNTIALAAGADSQTFTFPSSSDTVVTLAATQILTNKTLTSPILQGTIDGWITSTDTWTYASASTFTISGVDRTAIYTKGTKLKFTNSTGKYAVVVSSAFSTNTTVTIAVNTDYVIANAAITVAQYSYAEPPDWPTRFNIVPSGYSSGGGAFTNNPTASFFYFTLVNKNLILYTINLTYNGTSGGAGSTIVQGLPFSTLASKPGYGFGRSYTNGFQAVAYTDQSISATDFRFDKYDGNTAITNSANWVIQCFQPI